VKINKNRVKKRVLAWCGLLEYMDEKKKSSKLPTGSTVLIHIGKCGGKTLRNGLKNAVSISDVQVVHGTKPVYRNDLKYIIVARGPISRLSSAFRWRYELVVTDGAQRDRFKGEYDVLLKYGNLNNLAEALHHNNGTANTEAQQEIRKIRHIKEDISFYLHELLNKCHPSQIVAVLMQENLDDDILRVFGYKNELKTHHNPASAEDGELSDTGLRNLMRFFREDYEALIKLYSWGKIERDSLIKAI